MRTLAKVVIFVVVLAILAGAAFLIHSRRPARRTVAATEIRGVPVVASVARKSGIADMVHATGTISPQKEITVMPEVPGRIEGLFAVEADSVAKGEKLAVIEHDLLDAQLDAARSGVEVAKTQLKAVDVKIANLRREKERLERLQESGSASGQALDQIVSGYNEAIAQREVVEAQIRQAEASLKSLELRIEDATVVSPLAGIVVEDFDREVGQTVAPTMPLFRVAVLDTLKVKVSLTEVQMAKVSAGQRAVVRVAKYGDTGFGGKVARVAPALDPRSHMGEVEIEIPNPRDGEEYRLKPGMFASVDIVVDENATALVVPSSAVVTESGEKPVVYICDGDYARERQVQLGITTDELVEVKSGIEAGELVVVSGARMLEDGVKIEAEEQKR